ncbi:MAG: hypothetical protein E6G35_09060, partial [Actinobacteria bacterium]
AMSRAGRCRRRPGEFRLSRTRTDGTATTTPSTVDNPIRFAGMYLDPTLGTRYTTPGRPYDPGTGRFASTDPLPRPGTSAATSSYAYAADDPLSLTDPLGADPCTRPWAAQRPRCAQLLARLGGSALDHTIWMISPSLCS